MVTCSNYTHPLSIIIIFFVLILCGLQTVCGNAELKILMEMKASLDPENKYLTSWTSNGDPCGGSFMGVACNEHRKVANISLQGKSLNGRIPAAVSGLKCLSGLYLHYNNLSGEIPREISELSELSDLYLNVNSLSGSIPSEIGNMANLQVLDLCCNQFSGSIPTEIGVLKKLSTVFLEHNRLTGQIPTSLGNLGMLTRLDLSFNGLSGQIPSNLANVPQLEFLNVENNTLNGLVPPALKRLNERFNSKNNPGLCGIGFPSVRACTAFDNVNLDEPIAPMLNTTKPPNIPQSANVRPNCNRIHCSNSSKLRKIFIVVGVVTVTVSLLVSACFTILWYRRRKQKIWSKSDHSEDRLSTDQMKDVSRRSASPLVNFEYSCGWDPHVDLPSVCGVFPESLQRFRFNLEEIESATQYFSEVNLLGRSKFSAVYKGVLKDRSVVAIKTINETSCKSEETEFVTGLCLLTSLKHENLARLRGFCCSKGRGECFLVYDFASKGNLAQYLDLDDGSSRVLDWRKRVSIINGIAKGVAYLHSSESDKPAIIHRNISIEKILIDQQFNPLITDAGLLKLLADDIVFSALKVSAALGYMAPEYITTGRFTEKSDVYAFGVIILQILSGKSNLTHSIRKAAESSNFDDFIDENLHGEFSELEAAKLTRIAVICTDEVPENRLTMEAVIQELSKSSDV